MLQISPVSPIEGYMVSARGLLPSLALLASAGPDHLRALALVGGFIVECALKAFLSHQGISEDELKRRPLGHNLEALWERSAGCGLNIQLLTPQWCITLNSLHDQPYHLRYQSKVHGLSFPVPGDMLAYLPVVVEAVERALQRP
jgi:hypothetical protein